MNTVEYGPPATFSTKAAAQANCVRGVVVWIDPKATFLHDNGIHRHGPAAHGAYRCRAESVSANPKTETRTNSFMPWLQNNWLSLLAFFAAAASAFYAWKLTRTTRDSLHLSALLSLTQEARQDEFIDMMQDVLKINVDSVPGYMKYLATLSPAKRNQTERAVRKVSYFLDNVGLYVRRGIIESDIAVATFGSHAANAWQHLEWRHRETRNPVDSYPHNFRWFAHLAEQGGHQAFKYVSDWRQDESADQITSNP